MNRLILVSDVTLPVVTSAKTVLTGTVNNTFTVHFPALSNIDLVLQTAELHEYKSFDQIITQGILPDGEQTKY